MGEKEDTNGINLLAICELFFTIDFPRKATTFPPHISTLENYLRQSTIQCTIHFNLN